MLEWLEGIAGPQYVPAILWTLAALVGLVIVLFVVKQLRRGATGGAFVAGGRNRKTRLSIMDATAVDSHRRLVLVRRDDVEHLLLIGGATDIVVESNIRLVAPTRKPAPSAEAANNPQPRPAEPAVQPPPLIRPAPPPRSELPPRTEVLPRPAPQPIVQRQPPPEIRPAPRPVVQPRAAAPAPRPAPAPAPISRAPMAADDLDTALLQELEVTLDHERDRSPRSAEASLEDEMTRLLGELSTPKK